LAALAFVATLALPVIGSAESAGEANVQTAVPAEIEFAAFEDRVFVEARRSGAPIVLYFEADWCAPCKEMHARTFRAPAVLEAAAGFRLFRVDLTNPDRHLDLVKKSFRVVGAPTLILFGPDGKESGRRFGFIPPDDLAEMLGKSRGAAESSRLNGAPARSRFSVAPARTHFSVAPARS